MKVLGIESSCDETSVAIVDQGRILANLVASQDDVHARFGGVVPELASRRHIECIVPLITEALAEAQCKLSNIEGVAATFAPGLVGALLVGLSTAKGIALARHLPFIAVNHLEGHLNAAHVEHPSIPYPHVALIVSGGHTSLYVVEAFGMYRLLGATRDDAAGEAFDKVAKLLGLGFPGGPAIDRLAADGNPRAFRFPSPRFTDGREYDFSFSGIKTAVSLTLRKAREHGEVSRVVAADLAASFQETVVTILTDRLVTAATSHHARAVILSGGVAANRRLRSKAAEMATSHNMGCFIPSPKLCTDNAAMIAFVGEKYLIRGTRSALSVNAVANQEIGV